MLFVYELFKFFDDRCLDANLGVAHLVGKWPSKFESVLLEELLDKHVFEVTSVPLLFLDLDVFESRFSSVVLPEFKNLNGSH